MFRSFAALIFATLLFFYLFFTLSRPLSAKIIACDVGQGDAILIQYGQFRVLVDSGPNSAVLRCFPQEAFFGRPKIDVVILTHWDKDHAGGAKSILENFEVGLWVINTLEGADSEMAEELFTLLQKEPHILAPLPGDQISLPGMRLRFLWSQPVLAWLPEKKIQSAENAGSIGMLLAGQSFGFLSLGDLECPQELAVLTLPLLTPYQILKISHHGAKTSSCLEFLQQARPEIALISVGKGNQYGHPVPEILSHLRKVGAKVLRTDLDGRIELQLTQGARTYSRGNEKER